MWRTRESDRRPLLTPRLEIRAKEWGDRLLNFFFLNLNEPEGLVNTSKQAVSSKLKGNDQGSLTVKFSTVDLLVPTSSDKLLFKKLKILFTLVAKQATLMRRSTVLILPLQLVFPGLTHDTPESHQCTVNVTWELLLNRKDQHCWPPGTN
jgi:hypothetical protein